MKLLTTAACCLLISPALAEDWRQWRGPSRDGQLSSDQRWPDSLADDSLTQQWHVPLGPSYSGPIVCGSRVFVTETRDSRDEVVRALDRHTGRELWQTEWLGSLTVPFFAQANGSWIRSTPACDGERLLVAGMRDVLVCLDVETGDEAWRVDFVNEFETELPGFGTVCSPLIDGPFVYLQAAASVVKLRIDDGEILWRSPPEAGGLFGQSMGASAFSSPVIATLAGTRQLLVQSRTRLAGIDLETGEPLWSVEIPAFRGMNILTPLAIGDAVFTSSYGGGSFLFEVTKSEAGFAVIEQWQNRQEGYMSSPVLIDGFLYLHLRNQRFTCIDPSSGKTRWTSTPQGKYVSMAVNGQRILALDQRGELRLIEANPEQYDELAMRTVSDSTTWAHVAVAGDQIFVRALDGISAWSW